MMKLYYLGLLLTIFACASLKEGQASCPQNWLSYGKECLNVSDAPYTFMLSNFTCSMMGGDLVSISSQETLEFLIMHLNSNQGTNFWVGLYQSSNTSFQWPDQKLVSQDQYWVSLPMTNSSVETEMNATKCFAFNGEVVKYQDCNSLYGDICSKKKPLFNPVENCLTGQTEHSFIGEVSGNCIYRSPDATKMSNVDSKCSETGGRFLDLYEIAKEGLTAFREHKIMTNDGFKYWTAMTYNNSKVYWRDGLVLSSYLPLELGKGSCVAVSFNFETVLKVKLHQTECEDHAHVICAAPRITSTLATPLPLRAMLSCPQGLNWKTLRGRGDCFWETSFETNRLSWDDARAYCQGYGGDLASFHSIEEEKLGLSFQYGSLLHPYWIGLRLDPDTETYKWSDGKPLDYQNWAPGHPNHMDKRLQCVAMSALDKHWISSLCGIISWFVCRAPKQTNPAAPVIPTRPALIPCEESITKKMFYFEGYCYEVVNLQVSWYRAKEYCENKGSSLVSIHSDEEIGFLLRLLYDDKNTRGNRVWIGLNSLSGIFKWTDYSPVDMTYWNIDEPNNYLNQEKCGNMYIGNGLWNDENCFSDMGFICKQNKDATVTPEIQTTIDPRIGHCQKGWYPHHDRCYLPVGNAVKDRANWTKANGICQSLGGHLVSIRDQGEQAFLSYLLQGLKEDAWIGLHDTIKSGRYYWVDNSNMQYTNWGVGEPSFFGMQEDCVKMVYEDLESGMWHDDGCSKNLPFICYAGKDPNLPQPTYNRGMNCIYPEGWLKLDDLCFKMYVGEPLRWSDAEAACIKEGAHLISISGPSIQAVATYLATEVNQTFWIGLEYKASKQQFEWLNGWIMTLSKWGRGSLTMSSTEDSCFASSSDGYWNRYQCNEQMPYICQITTGKGPSPRKYRGECPMTFKDWVPTDGSYCHLLGKSRVNWYTAMIRCFSKGSTMISFHSFNDVEMAMKTVKSSQLVIQSVFIGLFKNGKGGFFWSDHSPVDFVNWDEDQPENEQGSCVEMLTYNFKWRVVPCSSTAHYMCSHQKDQDDDFPEKAKYGGGGSSGLSAASWSAIVVCVTLVIIIIIGALFFRPSLGKTRFSFPFRQHSMSFENALYNANSSSMEFQDDRKDSCDSR